MQEAYFRDIPWRRNDVETLNEFLLSAKDRCAYSSQVDKRDREPSGPYRPLLLCHGNGVKASRSMSPSTELVHRQPRKFMSAKELDVTDTIAEETGPTPSDDSSAQRSQNVANIFILRGQTGCGKVSAVRSLCRDIGLKIIEYDPFEIETINSFIGEGYEAVAGTLLRFLDSTRRKHGLRMTSVSGGTQSRDSSSSSKSYNPTPGWIKRLKLVMGGSQYQPENRSDIRANEPHIILLKHLPRSILNSSNSDSVRRIQEIMQRILEGNNGKCDIASFPVLICVNNSESDRLMLKSLLPWNYESHPRCFRLNVTQIAKSRIKTLLTKHLRTVGRPRSPLNDKLIDVISAMCFGDIRYAMENLDFYSISPIQRNHVPETTIEGIRYHMLERNASNGAFKLLGKVLANKRVPVTMRSYTEYDTSALSDRSKPEENDINKRFEACFKFSQPVTRCGLNEQNFDSCIYPDYSDVLEILPAISDELADTRTALIDLEDPSQCTEYEEVVHRVAGSNGYGMVNEETFHASLLGSTPLSVRILGLVEAFNASFPLSMCQWPSISYELTATPAKYPRTAMLPRLTRPGMYYVPEEMIDNSYTEVSFLVNCCFENYVKYYDSIDDCAVLGTHLCAADVYVTGTHYTSGQPEEFIEQIHRTFASICIRATSDSNLGAMETSKSTAFSHFGRNIWQSESRYDMERLRDLYDSHRKELMAKVDRDGYSKNLGSVYMCKQRAFVEIVPFMYMMHAHDTGLESTTKGTSLEMSANISNIMTESMIERIDILIERSNSTPRTSSQEPDTGTGQGGAMSALTPKFKELLFEIGKRY